MPYNGIVFRFVCEARTNDLKHHVMNFRFIVLIINLKYLVMKLYEIKHYIENQAYDIALQSSNDGFNSSYAENESEKLAEKVISFLEQKQQKRKLFTLQVDCKDYYMITVAIEGDVLTSKHKEKIKELIKGKIIAVFDATAGGNVDYVFCI